MSEHTPENDALPTTEYIWSLCQTCGVGVYLLTEQGVECDRCSGVAGIAGALPPIRITPTAVTEVQS